MWISSGGHLSFLPNGQNDIMKRTARLLSLMNTQWQIHERGLVGLSPPPPPIIFRPNWSPKGQKKCFWDPPLISGSGWPFPLPPYLKVWAHHWNWQCTNAIKMNYSRTPYFEVPREMEKKFEIAGFQNNRGSIKGKGKSKGIGSSFEIAGTSN